MKPIVARVFQPLPDIAPRFCKPAQPLPARQSALWKYKAIGRQGDDRAGQWSDAVRVPVAG